MDFPIPRCTPEEVGIPSAHVEACIRALSHPLTTMNAVSYTHLRAHET